MQEYQVTCARCGKSFTTTKYKFHRNKQHYCDRECQGNKIQIKCANCGKESLKDGYTTGKYANRFCNESCHQEYIQKNKFTQERTCQQCGEKFIIRAKPTKNLPFKYCSKSCHNRAMDVRRKKICPVCKCEFLVKPCDELKGHGVYCSRRCRFAGKKPTIIELIVGNILRDAGVDYVSQFRVGRYVCDYFVPSRNLIIECDGSYWHSIPKVKERDNRKNEYLESRNYRILRLGESEIKNNKDMCIHKIKNELGIKSEVTRYIQLSF